MDANNVHKEFMKILITTSMSLNERVNSILVLRFLLHV